MLSHKKIVKDAVIKPDNRDVPLSGFDLKLINILLTYKYLSI